MFKYLIWVLKLLPTFTWSYFTWMVPYSRHPEKYSLEKRYYKVRKIILKLLKILKIDIQVSNYQVVKKGEVYCYMGNHISFLDALVLIALSEEPLSFVSKIESKKYLFVGRIITIIDGLYLERDNLKQEIKVYQVLKGSLVAGDKSWAIFAEGTRNNSYNSNLLELKPGSFKSALTTGRPIAPFCIWGTQVPLKKFFKFKKYPVLVEFFDIIETSKYSKTTVDLAKEVTGLIEPGVANLRTKYNEIIKYKINPKNKKQKAFFLS